VTHGSTRALLSREVGTGAMGHVAAPKPSSVGRRGSELRDTWQHILLLVLASCLYAGVPSLQGTDSGSRAHLRRGNEFAGGAITSPSRLDILNFYLGS
jgi:hypothetical protein